MSRHMIERPMKAKGVVHKMIADTAKGCCRAAWEDLAKQNRFYERNRDVERFVTQHWPKYIPVARAILTGMLGNPKYTTEMRDEIAEVLLKDGAVNPKTMAAPEKPRFFLNSKS